MTLSNNFYPVISLAESKFRNNEIVNNERFRSKRFLVLDFKEVQNEYFVIFVNDLKEIQVMGVEKVQFEGLVSADKMHLFMPILDTELQPTTEEESYVTVDKDGIKDIHIVKGRKKKEA